MDSKPQLILETFRLSEAPRYIAISYTWGSSNTTKEILVNEHAIPIRINLWVVLLTLSYHQNAKNLLDGKDTWFFVDAICIDQDSIDVKNHRAHRLAASSVSQSKYGRT